MDLINSFQDAVHDLGHSTTSSFQGSVYDIIGSSRGVARQVSFLAEARRITSSTCNVVNRVDCAVGAGFEICALGACQWVDRSLDTCIRWTEEQSSVGSVYAIDCDVFTLVSTGATLMGPQEHTLQTRTRRAYDKAS